MWPFKAKPRWEIVPRLVEPPHWLGHPPRIVFDVHDRTGASVPWRGEMFTGKGTFYASADTRELALSLIERREALEKQLANEERTDVPALR